MKAFLLAAALGTTAILGGASFAAAQDAAPKPGHRDPMMKADANKDGVISRDEAMALADTRFAKMDANRDGKATAAEVKAGRDAMRAARPAKPLHVALDPNRDGAATKEEFRARAAKMFDRVDANRDGKIDATEQQAMRGKMRMHRGHKGGGHGPAPVAAPDGDVG